MRVELVTPPASAAIALSDIKQYTFSNSDAFDAQYTSLIQAGTNYVENHTGRKLITQTYDIYMDRTEYLERLNAYNNTLSLYSFNVQSISSLTVYDPDNSATIVSSSDYRLSGSTLSAQCNLVFNDSANPPTTNMRLVDSIKIQVIVGYGDDSSDVPSDLTQALAVIIDHWSKNGSKRSSNSGQEIPENFKALVAPYMSMSAFF